MVWDDPKSTQGAPVLSASTDLPDLKTFTKSLLFYPFVMDHADKLGAIIGNEYTWTKGYLVEANEEQAFARLGHLIVHPEFWRIDIRLEIVATMLDFLFDQGVARVEAREDAENAPALDVLRILGFKHEGVRRNSIRRHDGKWLDRMVVAITPEDWTAARPRLQKQILAARNR